MRRAYHPTTGFEAGIRRKALRAAATVAVILGGCSADAGGPVQGSVDAAALSFDGSSADGEASAQPNSDNLRVANDTAGADAPGGQDAQSVADAAGDEDAPLGQDGNAGQDGQASAGDGDTQVASADAGAADAGADVAQADAADADNGDVCRVGDDWQTYKKCCEHNNWSFKKGCMAWGPPMPRAMKVLA